MTPTTAITRLDLSATFSEFDLAASRKGFIGAKILRPFMTALQSAEVKKIKLEQLLQDHDTSRAASGGYRRGAWEFDSWSYHTEEAGWEEPLSERDVNLYGDIFRAEQVSANRALDFVVRKFERVVAALIYNTTTWTGGDLTTALTNEWDDKTNATPIEDLRAARAKILSYTGLAPNALICNWKQWDHLRHCDEIVDDIKYTQNPFAIPTSAVAQALGLDSIIVAGEDNLHNTANEAQTRSLESIWSDEYAMLARVATSDDPREPCLGRTFVWTGDGVSGPGGGEDIGVVVEEYREEGVRGSVYRVRTEYGHAIMYPQAAHLLSNVITI